MSMLHSTQPQKLANVWEAISKIHQDIAPLVHQDVLNVLLLINAQLAMIQPTLLTLKLALALALTLTLLSAQPQTYALATLDSSKMQAHVPPVAQAAKLAPMLLTVKHVSTLP